jgi:competence protein ComEC
VTTGGSDGSATPVRRDVLDVRVAVFTAGVWAASLVGLARGVGAAVLMAAAGGTAAAAGVLADRLGGPDRPRGSWARRVLTLLVLGVAAGGSCTAFSVAVRDAEPIRALAVDRATVTVVVAVRDDPRRARSSPPGRPTFVVPARLSSIDAEGRSWAVGGRVLVLANHPGWDRLLPGQRVRAEGRLAPPSATDLTAAVLSARGPPRLLGTLPWYERAAGALRAGLQQACAGLPPDRGGLLPGLVVGDTSRLDPVVEETFRDTGMTHLLAVSGSNCAIVVGAVLALLRLLRAGPRTCAAVSGLALVGFVILVRPSPSVLRAATMGAVALLALAVGRPRAALPALAAAAGLLMLVDPALARSPGFALSVLATLGLVVLAPRWRDALQARGLPALVAEALAVPAAAQVACAPVLAALSGGVGLVAVPANLLAVPAVAPATVLGVVAALLSVVTPDGAAGVAWLASWPAWWLVTVARTGSGVPGATAPWPGGVWGGAALAGFLALVLVAARWTAVRRVVLAVAAAAVLVALPIRIAAPGWPPDGWRLVGCDVGQGDAEVLRTGPGSAVVVDAGPDPGPVDSCLRRLGVRSVPLLVLSHAHTDHVGGVRGVLTGRTVGGVLTSGDETTSAVGRLVVAEVQRHGIPVLRVGVGSVYRVGDLRLEVIGPVRRFRNTRSDPNNNSLVLRAHTGGMSVLLTGDVEHEAQQAMLDAGVPVRADVLKVPHHGSGFSEPGFLDAVRPRVAVIGVGAGNDYGHPNTAVVARLQRAGARVLRTDVDGDVAVAVAEGRVTVAVRGRKPAARPP